MKSNFLIIHGSFGNPFINWFAWLQKEIEKTSQSSVVPSFPVGIGLQTYENWAKLVDYYRNIGLVNDKTIFIGHSIGAIFIVKNLMENKLRSDKIILVSGFNNYSVDGGDYDKVNSSFFIDDIAQIRGLAKEIFCFYSDNDPYVSQEALTDFADKIATEKFVVRKGGHLNSESGFDTFEQLLGVI